MSPFYHDCDVRRLKESPKLPTVEYTEDGAHCTDEYFYCSMCKDIWIKNTTVLNGTTYTAWWHVKRRH